MAVVNQSPRSNFQVGDDIAIGRTVAYRRWRYPAVPSMAEEELCRADPYIFPYDLRTRSHIFPSHRQRLSGQVPPARRCAPV